MLIVSFALCVQSAGPPSTSVPHSPLPSPSVSGLVGGGGGGEEGVEMVVVQVVPALDLALRQRC